MLSHAKIENVEMDKYVSVPQGLAGKVSVEFHAADEELKHGGFKRGEFKPGLYYLDIDPPNLDIKSLTPHTAHAHLRRIDPAKHPNPGREDRWIEIDHPVSAVNLSFTVTTANLQNNHVHYITARLFDEQRKGEPLAVAELPINVTERALTPPLPTVVVSKDVVGSPWTDDVVLFALIKKASKRLGFTEYRRYMDFVLCGKPLRPDDDDGVEDAFLTGDPRQGDGLPLAARRFLPFNDTDAYRVLKTATEAFVAVKSVICPTDAQRTGVTKEELAALALGINATGFPGDPVGRYIANYLQTVNGSAHDVLPYYALIAQKLSDFPFKESIFPAVATLLGDKAAKIDLQQCTGVLRRKLTCPIMIELIWSYWHEQGMQVQSMYALRDRFQNRRSGAAPDPLANMEMGYLRPLNNIFWGYIQDEQHRLTLARRVYEYDHHYGLTLMGTAVPPLQPADSRSKFLEAFHNLLYLCTVFFKEDDDTNRKADAFPILNAIKEVHFLLSEGAHNQYGDLPTTSRIEMLMEQWMLARPELQQFLPSRESIAYPEPWMGTVDAMKTVQGWTNTSVMYFHDLAVFGEQILLSIRFNNWSQIFDRTSAANWARVWRSEIQAYMHAYRTVTSVDLTIEPTELRLAERRVDPSVLLARRLDEQRQLGAVSRGGARLPPTPTAALRLAPPRPAPR